MKSKKKENLFTWVFVLTWAGSMPLAWISKSIPMFFMCIVAGVISAIIAGDEEAKRKDDERAGYRVALCDEVGETPNADTKRSQQARNEMTGHEFSTCDYNRHDNNQHSLY